MPLAVCAQRAWCILRGVQPHALTRWKNDETHSSCSGTPHRHPFVPNMPPKMARAAPKAAESEEPGPSIEDMLNVDLDEDADQVSDKEALDVLKELGLIDGGGKKPVAKTATKPVAQSGAKPAPHTAAPLVLPTPPGSSKASLPPPPPIATVAATIGARVEERVTEYQRAAVMAKKEGRGEDALVWLRRSKELARAIEDVLQQNPPCEEYPANAGAPSPSLS